MQPTMPHQPGSRPELPLEAPSRVGLRGVFELTPEAHIERTIDQLAALLISVSRNNQYEGRDPACIPDNLASGFVADLLGVDIGMLTDALIALQQRGLVRAEGHGLRLTNMSALERLAS
ncbi:hypothetical protein GIW81_15665 [Hyphomicrobium sp. xq]|uniref:Crp-like helix-turn-helix domain-containing protein n=1 Tax=Hyphomicrobium album TaxID=2665159 RepID=A0A6I3KQB8_9HYPH|nr:winged helix-turn-helix domain-containing protein [Hyphomicrobium album]MTD95776.1 hypothetical protein [Hyphomicrobium album]